MTKYDSIDQLPEQHREQARAELEKQKPRIVHPSLAAVTTQELDNRVNDGNVFHYEHDFQAAVFQWADDNLDNMPELAMMYAVPNGGHRLKSVGAKMKREGAKAGYPDINLDVARDNWHGLRIELKCRDNKPTPSQWDWLHRLRREGYKTAVCRDLSSVVSLVTSYLKGES